MFIPLAVLLVGGIVIAALLAWLAMLLSGRNPLPFPDGGSRIFSAASPEAKAAVVDLLAMHGVRERFQANTKGVLPVPALDWSLRIRRRLRTRRRRF